MNRGTRFRGELEQRMGQETILITRATSKSCKAVPWDQARVSLCAAVGFIDLRIRARVIGGIAAVPELKPGTAARSTEHLHTALIGNEIEREAAWRLVAEAAVTGEELVKLSQSIREWDRIVELLRRPAVNDNKKGPRPIWTGRPPEASQGS